MTINDGYIIQYHQRIAIKIMEYNMDKFTYGHKKRSTAVLQPLLTLNLIL